LLQVALVFRAIPADKSTLWVENEDVHESVFVCIDVEIAIFYEEQAWEFGSKLPIDS
jgi:hypothetical protein